MRSHPNSSISPVSTAAARGFTLLELMIVLIIIAVVLAVAWPSLRRPFNRAGTLEAARQLAADVARARRLAITRGETIALRFERDGTRYIIEPAEPAPQTESDDGLASLLGDELGDEEAPADEAMDETADADFAIDTSIDSAGSADVSMADEPLPPLEPIEQELPNGVMFADPNGGPVDAGADDLESAALAEQPADEAVADPDADELTTLEKLAQADQEQAASENWSTAVLFFPTGRAESIHWRLKGPDDYWVTVTLRGMTGAVQIGRLEHPIRAGVTGDDATTADASEPVEWSDTPLNAAPVDPAGAAEQWP